MKLSIALDFADKPRPYPSLAAPADTKGELYEALKVLAAHIRRIDPTMSKPRIPESK